jgi:hypothetical protein
VPLFIDVHHTAARGLDEAAAAQLHLQDLAVQDRFGVRYLRYWFDPATGKAFCLSEAPNVDAVMAVHRASHGVVADEIFAVYEGGG